MGAEFEKAASVLPKGKISDVVKTLDGFHIIRVDDKQEAHMKTLDEVKAEIEPVVKQQKTQEVAQKQADDLLQQATAQGLDAAAAAKGVPGHDFRFFWPQRSGSGTGAGATIDGRGIQRGGKDASGDGYGRRKASQCSSYWRSNRRQHPLSSRLAPGWKSNSRTSARALCWRRTRRSFPTARRRNMILRRPLKELGATVKTSDFVLPDGQVSRYRLHDRASRGGVQHEAG